MAATHSSPPSSSSSRPPSSRSGRPRAFSRFDPRGAWARLGLATFVAAFTWWASPAASRVATRVVAAWDAAALTLVVIAAWIVVASDSRETQRRASAADPGRTVIWLLVLACCTFSVFASAVVLRRAKAIVGYEGDLLSALALGAVVFSWTLAHLAFTLRYARLYYREEDGVGGIEFPGGEPPDDADFAYFAFTLGMCFQVSDATITGRAIRRTALAHAVLSFAYNTVVLALALNLVFGLLG